MINLPSTPTHLINLDSQVERLNNVTGQLRGSGVTFKRFSGTPHAKGIIGCGMSHKALLSQIDPITLILEDDINITDDFTLSYPYPDEADAIYLGVSKWGYISPYATGIKDSVIFTDFSDEYLRVHNMCSTHAILYLSEKYITAAKEKIEECLKTSFPFDLGLASIHKDFIILAPRVPLFYQESKVDCTKFKPEVTHVD